MTKLIILLLFYLLIGCNQSSTNKPKNLTISETTEPTDHEILGEGNARIQLKEALKGGGQTFTWDTLIKNPLTAIALAEPLLFDAFGKEVILEEKPYEVYLIDGYWYISGTIPKGWKGGAFEIIFSARTGEIIRITHYK